MKDTNKARPNEILENAEEIQNAFSNEPEDEATFEENQTEGLEIYYITPEDLNQKQKCSPTAIFETKNMRDITNQLFEFLACTTIDYCFLSGEFSVGKATIVENLVQKINSKKCPAYFLDSKPFQFIQFDAKDFENVEDEVFITSIVYAVKEYYDNEYFKIAVIIKHLNYVSDKFLTMFYKLYQTIALNCEEINLKFIFTVHVAFWKDIPNYSFLCRSVIKAVEKPKFEEICDIISLKVNELEQIHGCTISEKLLDFLLTLVMSNEESPSIKNYIYHLDLVLTRVELESREEVTIEDIYHNFEDCFNDWKSFPEPERVRIAYHEAGHTVLGLIALKDYYQLLAVTSIPSMKLSSLGATIEFFKTHLYNVDKKLLKKFLAFYLAGRESELIAGYKPNNGASSDLARMSMMLVDTIATTGLFKNVSMNYAFDLDDFISEEAIVNIEKEAKKFAKKASKYANKVLSENWQLVEKIANKLLDEGIISGTEVEKIYQNYLKKSKNKKK